MIHETLKLIRPLVVFDTETTGTNPRSDRIVEIACLKIHPDGRREEFVKRLNPRMPIPPMLRIEFLRAEVPFSIADRRLVDAQRIFFAKEPRHLSAAARFYCQSEHEGAHGALADAEMTLRVLAGQLARYEELPHSVSELHELYCAGLDQDLDPEGRFRLVKGEPTVNFGKNRGRALKDISRDEPGFLRWILKGDFSQPVKDIARKYLPAEGELFR